MPSAQDFAVQALTDGIASGFDFVHMPDIYYKLVGQYPRQKDLGFLMEMGSYKESKQTNVSWNEENRLNAPFTIAATQQIIAGVTVRITLSAGDHYQVPSGANASYPRVYDRVEFRNGCKGFVIAKNQTVANAHTIDVQSVNPSLGYNPVAAAVIGQQVGIFSMGFGEGGKGPLESIVPVLVPFTAQHQIFRDKFDVTTTEQTNGSWQEFTWPEGYPNAGETSKCFFIKAQGDTYDRFMFKREMGLFTNDIDDKNINVGTDIAIRQTRGFIPHVQRYGESMNYANKVTMGTFETMQRLLNKNFREPDNLLLMGQDFSIGLTSFATDLMQKGGVLYNSSDGKPMDSVALGFKMYSFASGFNFHTKNLNILNSADTTGLPGFPYSGMGIICPTTNKIDATTKESFAPITIRYKRPVGGGKQKGWYKMWFTGAGAEIPTNDVLNTQLDIASEEAMQVMGAKGFISITKAA